MFCRKCGKEIEYDSDFCVECANKIAEDTISASVVAENSSPNASYPEQAPISARRTTVSARAALIKGIISSAASFSGLFFATAIVQLSMVMTNLGVILLLNSFALVIGGLILGISAVSNYRRSPDEDRSIVSLILGIVGICFSAMALFYMFFIFIVVYITLFAFGGGFWWL